MARKAIDFLLEDGDRQRLKKISRSGLMPYRSVTRATILLLLESGLTPKEVSFRLNISAPVVFKWRSRYLAFGIDGLEDLPRSGLPKNLPGTTPAIAIP
jgi:transposase